MHRRRLCCRLRTGPAASGGPCMPGPCNTSPATAPCEQRAGCFAAPPPTHHHQEVAARQRQRLCLGAQARGHHLGLAAVVLLQGSACGTTRGLMRRGRGWTLTSLNRCRRGPATPLCAQAKAFRSGLQALRPEPLRPPYVDVVVDLLHQEQPRVGLLRAVACLGHGRHLARRLRAARAAGRATWAWRRRRGRGRECRTEQAS